MDATIWIVIIVIGLILIGVTVALAIYFSHRSGSSSVDLPAVLGVKTTFATNNGANADGWGSYTTFNNAGSTTGCAVARTSNSIGFVTINNGTTGFGLQLLNAYQNNTVCGANGIILAGNFATDPGQSRIWSDQTSAPEVYFTFYNNCGFVATVGPNRIRKFIGTVDPTSQYVTITLNNDNSVTVTTTNI